MDPNPKSFPILSYVLTRFPSFGPKSPTSDVEQPPPTSPSSQPPILSQMPHLSDPKLLASMKRAISDVSQTRAVLRTLGPRPDHESVDTAKQKLSETECTISEKERSLFKTIVQLEMMHEAYEKLLKDAEKRLVEIYENAKSGKGKGVVVETVEEEEEEEAMNEEVVAILHRSKEAELDKIDLSNRRLRFLPEAFGKIRGLKVLNLSTNQLQMIPDSIAGLENLEELNLASNPLEALPDSIGFLQNLKILDVSSNKLETLPDTICHCRSLVELNVSFNRLTYLPTNIGHEMVNLERLFIQLNKLRSLPTSIGEMKSLRQMDAHFNEINGLPQTFGKLKSLESLNLSNNFSDLTELPDTFGDLTNLKELDLSNNQLHALPETFGRLENLTKLRLDANPLVVPPPEVVKEGVEAIKRHMSKRWLDILVEAERKSMHERQEEGENGWLTRSTSWLKNYATDVSETLTEYLSPKASRDPYLDQQL
ncbi:hypothetical protein K2173_028604 [Erythroxylum novogranatense]|uniref:PARP alpha-helical domain-containing protein n=1 Tax=Erythroxylum novogranatense TaxID=1862640 RepID=A0AAV8U2C6_9ROSI|nr:hypothetical protein K2173_028604 [Erythroxylum novogranatense]